MPIETHKGHLYVSTRSTGRLGGPKHYKITGSSPLRPQLSTYAIRRELVAMPSEDRYGKIRKALTHGSTSRGHLRPWVVQYKTAKKAFAIRFGQDADLEQTAPDTLIPLAFETENDFLKQWRHEDLVALARSNGWQVFTAWLQRAGRHARGSCLLRHALSFLGVDEGQVQAMLHELDI